MRPEPVRLCNAEGFEIDDAGARLDLDVAHGFLERSYRAAGIPRETVARALKASWCFGLYAPAGAQIGLARLITDFETFAYLADVFVLEDWRGRGLSKWMMQEIFALPAVRGLRRILLATRDAHGVYETVGFGPLGHPEYFMEINRPGIYGKAAA